MYKKTKVLIRTFAAVGIGLIGLSTVALSEEEHHDVHEAHEGHEWELGVSVGYANLKTEGEEGGNLHLHLLKRLEGDGFEKYFSVGFGAEVIVTTDNDKHYGAMVTLAAHPWRDLVLSVSPGFEWAKHEGSTWEREYATHLEAAYSFDVSENYHIGPVIGYSKTSDTEHYTVGIHIGIPLQKTLPRYAYSHAEHVNENKWTLFLWGSDESGWALDVESIRRIYNNYDKI